MHPRTLNALVHDREATSYDERFRIAFDASIGARVRRELERLTGPLPEAARALDVGCGTGYLALGIAAAGLARETHACDLSRAMLEQCAGNAARVGVHVERAACDAEHLPYAGGSFDVVCARGALHHVPSPLDALREIRRVLAPGGTAVVLAEPTPSGERQVAAVVGTLARAVDGARALARRPRDAERHLWELASMAANLHTFEPYDVETLALKAGFEDVAVGTASWAWVLALGLNYYLAGEFPRLASLLPLRLAGRAFVDAASVLDRTAVERAIPREHRHTVWAVLR